MPIIGLIDSGGARIQEGIEALHGYGEIFKRNVHYSGKVPQLSIMLGPCAGGAAYSPALSDVIFMVKRISQMFITGPKVLQAISGETMTSEELGGTDVHGTKSGLAHFVAETEQEAFDQVRTFYPIYKRRIQELDMMTNYKRLRLAYRKVTAMFTM